MNNLGPRWRACTANQLLSWLLEEYKGNKFEHVYLMDANFFVKPARVRDFAKGLSELLPGVTWSTSSTINYIIQMKDDFPLLIKQGLRLVEVGIVMSIVLGSIHHSSMVILVSVMFLGAIMVLRKRLVQPSMG